MESEIYAVLNALERIAERLEAKADAVLAELDKLMSERAGGRS